MDIGLLLNDEHRLLRDMVREFAAGEVAPQAAAIDRSGEFPRSLYRQMAELGLYGLMLPAEAGGSGGDTLMQGLVQEELGRVSATAANIQAAAHEVALTLHEHAPKDIAARYVPRILAGEIVPAFALTEPTAGSDAAGIRTTARRDGDSYVISGSKQFVTFGNVADFVLVMAVTDREKPRRNISAILVDMDTPGIARGSGEDLVGVRGTATASLAFEECRVPATNLIGEEGMGLRLGLSQIDKGRISTAGMAVGIAQAALELALGYARTRVQFSRPIFDFQAIQFKLAQMAMRIDAARLLYVMAAKLRDDGRASARASSEAKLFASETAAWVTDEALQIFGGYGYVRDNPIERFWRDAKICQIYEGTSNIQHLIIARELAREIP
jgi:alkylation response protein AidB-like acyl-CoA dehydrogenase